MAERFLEDYEKITNVRGMMGFTGWFKGVRVSLMSHGMGMPSASIYWHEMMTKYGVKKIIRTGTCGTTLWPKTKAGDIIVAVAAGTDSNMNRMRFAGWDFPATASFEMLNAAVSVAEDPNLGLREQFKASDTKVHVGNVFTSDYFYHP